MNRCAQQELVKFSKDKCKVQFLGQNNPMHWHR